MMANAGRMRAWNTSRWPGLSSSRRRCRPKAVRTSMVCAPSQISLIVSGTGPRGASSMNTVAPGTLASKLTVATAAVSFTMSIE